MQVMTVWHPSQITSGSLSSDPCFRCLTWTRPGKFLTCWTNQEYKKINIGIRHFPVFRGILHRWHTIDTFSGYFDPFIWASYEFDNHILTTCCQTNTKDFRKSDCIEKLHTITESFGCKVYNSPGIADLVTSWIIRSCVSAAPLKSDDNEMDNSFAIRYQKTPFVLTVPGTFWDTVCEVNWCDAYWRFFSQSVWHLGVFGTFRHTFCCIHNLCDYHVCYLLPSVW